MVLLTKEGDNQVQQTGQKLLGRMDFSVNRNAFGRQRGSFQTDIDILGKPFPGIFIRAPCVQKSWNDCRVLSTLGNRIVTVKQGNCLATAFHPELSEDVRWHEYFLSNLKR